MTKPYCPSCKRIIFQKMMPQKEAVLSKFCTWCKQHIPARQSKKSHREKKK